MKKAKMSKDFFDKNNNIILFYLKVNWKLILFFALCYLLVTLAPLIVTSITPSDWTNQDLESHIHLPFIIPGDLKYTGDPLHPNEAMMPMSIASALNMIIFQGFGIIFTGIFSLLMISRIIISEISNKRVVYWTNLPVSRTQILLSKYSFITLGLGIIFMPSFISAIIFSAIANDGKEYIGDVIGYGIETFIFYVFMLSVLVFIAILLGEKITVFNIIGALILLWIAITTILMWMESNTNSSTGGKGNTGISIYTYISIQSLIINPLNFIKGGTSGSSPIHISSDWTYTPYALRSNPIWSIIVRLLIVFGTIILTNFGSYKIFQNKALTI